MELKMRDKENLYLVILENLKYLEMFYIISQYYRRAFEKWR